MTRRAMPALAALVGQVKANPRLQIGLAAIALILAAWTMLVLADARAARVRELGREHERLAQIKQLAKQTEWTSRATKAEILRRALAAELPAARSAGLAQAEFEGWLRQIIDAQVPELSLETQAPTEVEGMAGVVQVTSVIAGSRPPDRVVQMLQRIEGHSQLVTVPQATIRDDGANRTFSLTVRGFYRLTAPDAPPAPR